MNSITIFLKLILNSANWFIKELIEFILTTKKSNWTNTVNGVPTCAVIY